MLCCLLFVFHIRLGHVVPELNLGANVKLPGFEAQPDGQVVDTRTGAVMSIPEEIKQGIVDVDGQRSDTGARNSSNGEPVPQTSNEEVCIIYE
jgi:hypothetical protein